MPSHRNGQNWVGVGVWQQICPLSSIPSFLSLSLSFKLSSLLPSLFLEEYVVKKRVLAIATFFTTTFCKERLGWLLFLTFYENKLESVK